MGIRFRRSIRVAPGVRINVTKTGLGLTVGPKGAHYSVHSSGRTTRSVGLPGTGLSYQDVSGGHAKPRVAAAAAGTTATATTTVGARGQSRKGALAAGVIAVLAVAYAMGGGGGSTSPSASPAGAAGVGLGVVGPAGAPGTSPLATAGGGSSSGAAPSTAPKATPRPKATAKPKATPRPPSGAASLALTLTVSSPVARNADATAQARTAASARCSIAVEYASGYSSAADLGDKTASPSGSVSWSWKIGGRTTLGSWPVTVTCTKGSASGSVTKTIRIIA